MKQIVVSSFYNCLIDDEEAIPTSTMLEIERIRKKGIVFSVCTNNFYKEVLDYNRDFPFLDYIIALNGSYIYDVKKEKTLYKKKLSKSIINKITEIYQDYELFFTTENKVLSNYQAEDIYKISIKYKKEISTKNLENLNVNFYNFTYNNSNYLEITSSVSSNFTALEKILTKEKTLIENVTVISSNEADIPLLENVKHKYITSNSPKSLRKYKAKLTTTNNKKGLEEVLKKL